MSAVDNNNTVLMRVLPGDEGQSLRRAGLDEPPQRVRVRVLFDQVAEPVELLLAQRGERGAGRRHEAAARGGGHLAQEGPPEAVRLQRAVPVRAPGLPDPAAVQAASRAVGEERLAAVDVGDPVVDLVALYGLAEGFPGGPGEGLLAGEPHPYGQQPEPVDAPAPALDLVLDVLAEDLEATADAEDRAPLRGSAEHGVRQSPLPQPLQGPGPSPGSPAARRDPRRPAPPAGPRTARRHPARRPGRPRR
ncbi:hypothetical protein GCM10020295_64810 [Streptomyces cinereospinus]